jgi:hypothetical protein
LRDQVFDRRSGCGAAADAASDLEAVNATGVWERSGDGIALLRGVVEDQITYATRLARYMLF